MTLSNEFLAKQKENLQTEKNKLTEQLNLISVKDKNLAGDFDATFPDYGRNSEDNATEEEEYVSRVGVENSLEIKLRDVTRALELIEEKKYGLCQECGEEIPQDRLLAMPSALRCLKHQ